MGSARQDRGPRRLLLLFGLSVALPALALAVLAYGTVAKERRALTAERDSALATAADGIRRDLDKELESLKRTEEERPYFHYNELYYDPQQVGKGLNFRVSPLASIEPTALANGYFQIDPADKVTSPQTAEVPKQAWAQGGVAQARRQKEQLKQQAEQVVDEVVRNLLPQMEQDRVSRGGKVRGQFPRNPDANVQQHLSQKAFIANVQPQQEVRDYVEGKNNDLAVEMSDGRQQEDEALIEVVLSTFLFEDQGKDGVLAYRYVDVPNEGGVFGKEPFGRLVQGFELNLGYISKTLVPELTARYLDVEGASAALIRDGAPPPPGEVVFSDAPDLLPGFRLVVTDADAGWVDRRVARFHATLLAAAGLLLVVIASGLVFTLRAVRQEIGLASRKSDFVAAVTHELRTPLTGIKMYADMLQAGWVKDEATEKEYIGFMAAETDRLARLVSRVLDFARSERGEGKVEAIDLAGPIREVERDFGPYIREKGFDLAVQIETEARVLADRDAVKQILLNLLENAVKYATSAEDRAISVRLTDDGSEVVLEVADHGPGVAEQERERIFTDFYRPGEELTREAPGAGLGLALVKRLADSMGGGVQVSETSGGGATFRVRLRRS